MRNVIDHLTSAYDIGAWSSYGRQYAGRAVLHGADGPIVGRDPIVAYDRLIKHALAATVKRDLFTDGHTLVA